MGISEGKHTTAWLVEDGIVRMEFKPRTRMGLEDSRWAIKLMKELCGGRRCCLLIEPRNLQSVSWEARDYVSGKEAKALIISIAAIVSSPLSRVLGSFFLGLNKPSYPTKLFTSESEALQWLRLQRDTNR
jgi:hypothetical protein